MNINTGSRFVIFVIITHVISVKIKFPMLTVFNEIPIYSSFCLKTEEFMVFLEHFNISQFGEVCWVEALIIDQNIM